MLDIDVSGPPEEIDVLGRPNNTMDADRHAAHEHILHALALERPNDRMTE